MGTRLAMIRCAVDFEIAKLAASSRIVKLVRSAAQTIRTRRRSEHDQGRPRHGSGGKRWSTAARRRCVIVASTSMREIVIVGSVVSGEA